MRKNNFLECRKRNALTIHFDNTRFFFLISINVTHELTCKHTEEEKKDRFYTRYVGVRST